MSPLLVCATLARPPIDSAKSSLPLLSKWPMIGCNSCLANCPRRPGQQPSAPWRPGPAQQATLCDSDDGSGRCGVACQDAHHQNPMLLAPPRRCASVRGPTHLPTGPTEPGSLSFSFLSRPPSVENRPSPSRHCHSNSSISQPPRPRDPSNSAGATLNFLIHFPLNRRCSPCATLTLNPLYSRPAPFISSHHQDPHPERPPVAVMLATKPLPAHSDLKPYSHAVAGQ